jgi:tyrosyl-tRNA synthetase
MTTPEPSIPKIAMAAYALDLGVPVIDFLLRLRLADDASQARELIASGLFMINEACFSDPEVVIQSRHLPGWSLVRAGERQVWVTLYTEDNGLR